MKKTVFGQIRAQEKEGRRRALSAIAEELLEKDGISGVTIKNLSQAAGLSTGAIYMYFKNKEEIFVHILADHLKNLELAFEKSMMKKKLPAIFQSMAEDYKSYYLKIGKYIDLFDVLAEAGSGNGAVGDDLMQTLRNRLDSIFKLVEGLLSRPEIKGFLKGVPPNRGVPVLWSIIAGLSHITLPSPRAREGGFDFSQTLEDMMTILLAP